MTTTTAPAPRPVRSATRIVAVYASLGDPGLYRFRWCPGRRLVGTIHLPRRRSLRGMTARQAIEAAAIGERGMVVRWGERRTECES